MFEPSPQYLAGFFDGEGSVSIHRGNKNRPNDWRLSVSVSQVDGRIPAYLKSVYGGYLRNVRRKSKLMPLGSPIWEWCVSLRKAEAFLRDIEPFVVVKRAQVELALEMMVKRKRSGRPFKHEEGDVHGVEAMAERMRRLNRKGGNHPDSEAIRLCH